MSAHCYHPWKFGDEITDGFIKVVANCLESNHIGWSAGGWTPAALAMLTCGDQFVWNVGAFIDQWDGENLEESVKEFVARSSDDESIVNQAQEVLIRVVQQLESKGLLTEKENDDEDGRTDL